MKAAPFAYHCPTTADEVAGLLARYGDEVLLQQGPLELRAHVVIGWALW